MESDDAAMESGRSTRQKRAIRRALMETERPLTPQEILAEAQAHCPGLGIATVYRAVRSWADEGWLSPVELPGQPDRFELSGKRHHHHFHCRSCGLVFEVEKCDSRVAGFAPPDFEVDAHEIVLYGRCASCAG
jgi:Fur family ferric uptake transcriptional regulator